MFSTFLQHQPNRSAVQNRHHRNMIVHVLFIVAFLTETIVYSSAQKPSQFRFTNIATDPASGLHEYRRAKSRTNGPFISALERSLTKPLQIQDIIDMPWATSGQPGVAVGDFNEGKQPKSSSLVLHFCSPAEIYRFITYSNLTPFVTRSKIC